MRLSPSAHLSRPWRIHEVARDFSLLDVWALPTPGGPDDFPKLVSLVTKTDLSRGPATVRALMAVRERVGGLLGWDGPETGLGTRVSTLSDPLPPELRERTPVPVFESLPAQPIYLTDDEFAAEIANQTVHGVLHLSWVAAEDGKYRGQLAVLVKPNGLLGKAYLAAISPFRHLIVYPALMRSIGSRWESLVSHE